MQFLPKNKTILTERCDPKRGEMDEIKVLILTNNALYYFNN